MRLVERWRSANKPTISFELFPPRTEKAAKKLPKVIDKLAAAILRVALRPSRSLADTDHHQLCHVR